MIVGTAGHVNHGKTSLVRALTGVDLDVLSEEKRRGMTIQLGFTDWTLPGGLRASLIDVPGHARLAHTMATGALGIDAVVLVVASDEGVMPQTREHLATCRALAIERGVVAVTRTDRAGDLARVLDAVASELASTALAGAPVVPVCAPRNEGLTALAEAMACVLAGTPAGAGDEGTPLLPVDRVFSQRGFGTIVTGSLLRGELHAGAEVELLPARVRARIRSLQIHGRSVERASAHQRVAVNLAGVEAGSVERNGFISSPDGMCVGRVFEAEIRWLEHMPGPLRSARSLGFVCGATRASARLTADTPIAPGTLGTARVVLDRDVALGGGLRFVLRGAGSAEFGATVGGGRILDASPPRRRKAAIRRALLDERGRVAALVEEAGRDGVDPAALAARIGCAPRVGPRLFSAAAVAREVERALSSLAAFERDEPERPGLPLRELGLGAVEPPVLAALEERGIEASEGLLRSRTFDRRAARDRHAAADAELLSAIEESALLGIGEAELCQGRDARATREAIARLERDKRVVRVSGSCYGVAALDALARAAARAVIAQGRLPVGWIKQHAGVSRKHAMLLWTHLDRVGVTRRQGESRVAGPRAGAFAG